MCLVRREKNKGKTMVSIEDTIENKHLLYGPFETQIEFIATIMTALDGLRVEMDGKGLTEKERAGYAFIVQKLARTVTAKGESAIDSWVDLMNYADKMGEVQTGKKPSKELIGVFYPSEKG